MLSAHGERGVKTPSAIARIAVRTRTRDPGIADRGGVVVARVMWRGPRHGPCYRNNGRRNVRRDEHLALDRHA